MKYHFSASARGRGLNLLPAAIGVIFFGGFFCFFWWTIIFGIVGIILFAVGLFMLGLGLSWVLLGGKWDISIDNDGINWQSPVISEGSFSYRFDEIEEVVRRIKIKIKSDGREKTKISYWLKGPEKSHNLSSQSGVDVDEVVALLADSGVKLREEVVRKDKSAN